MARRKNAPSDLDNAKLGREEAKRDAKRDAVPEHFPDVATMLRQHRDKTTDAERAAGLLKRASDAAWLELRGDQFDAEDRRDAASIVLAEILAEYAPNVPMLDDRHVSLTVMCGKVANERRRIQSQRERDHGEYLRNATKRGPDGFTEAERSALEDASIVAASDADAALAEARRLTSKLDCSPDGPVSDVLYQWIRDAAGPVCALERGYTPGSWRVRVSTGGKLLRAALTDSIALLDAVLGDADAPGKLLPEDVGIIDARATDGELVYSQTDASREARNRTRFLAEISSGGTVTLTGSRQTPSGYVRNTPAIVGQWREGTDAGSRPVRALDAEMADKLCRVRRMRGDAAKLARDAAARRDRVRRDHVETLAMGGKVRRMTVAGRSEAQALADAGRAIGRMYASASRREQSVAPPTPKRAA